MRTRAGAVLAVTALALSACAGIPSSGPVQKVRDDAGLGESTVRYLPAKPTEGASPEQVVRGFLDAMLAFPASTRTAATYLTPGAATSWNPSRGTSIYSKPEVAGRVPSTTGLDDPRAAAKGAVDVRLGFDEEARLDRQGHYTRRARPGAVTYTLEQVDGEWRITNPPDGIMINQKFFTDYYRSFSLFFFDRPGRRLVPDPVHLVVGDQLAANLVTSLVRGPRASIADGSRSYTPSLASLRPSVPVSADGVADVEFTADLGDASASARDHLSAQIVWTLRQVPGIDAVQVIGGSTPLTSEGREVQPITAWQDYGAGDAGGHGYALSENSVIQIDDGEVKPLSGAWGRDARGAVLVGVSDAGVAGVLAGRSQVRLTSRKGTGARTITGNDLIGPWWDDDGTLWLVDRDQGDTRVRVVEGPRLRRVGVAGLRDVDVDTFSLSPDGTRYVVTSPDAGRNRILAGLVLRDAKDRILGLGTPREVRTSARGVRSASWASSTQIGFLADSVSGVQVYQVPVDGSATSDDLARGSALLPDVDTDTLAIGRGEEPTLYTTDARRRLWFQSTDGSWRLLKASVTTGLTFGG